MDINDFRIDRLRGNDNEIVTPAGFSLLSTEDQWKVAQKIADDQQSWVTAFSATSTTVWVVEHNIVYPAIV